MNDCYFHFNIEKNKIDGVMLKEPAVVSDWLNQHWQKSSEKECVLYGAQSAFIKSMLWMEFDEPVDISGMFLEKMVFFRPDKYRLKPYEKPWR